MKLFTLVILFASWSYSFGQDTLTTTPNSASSEPNVMGSTLKPNYVDSSNTVIGLVEKKDERINLLIEDYIENKKFNGYRIQIFSSSNNRLEAVKAKSEFIRKFPEIKSYLEYQAPNYKVRVGDFLDRLEAHKILEKIKTHFPTAFLIKGEVEPKR